MSKPALSIFLVAIGVLTFPPIAPASQTAPQAASPGALKDKYHAVQVEKFDIQKDVQFPPEWIQPFQDEILKQFQHAQKFKEVLRSGENPADAAAPVLRMTGTITRFDPGSRGKRYVGFGAGAAEVLVHVVFQDRSTGGTILVEDIRGLLAGGLFGGESKDVTHEFAQTFVTTTKLLLEKPVPVHGEPVAAASAGVIPPAAVERKLLTISSRNFDKAQQDLNLEGAAGYRLAGFVPRGSRDADITMESSATAPQVYQYRLLHVQWLPNLQKDLNRAAEDGYRFCPRTLAQLRGSVAFAIVEKPPVPSKFRYQYRLHATMLVSSAQKDIQSDQREGFSLVGYLEVGGQHFVLMEKAGE